jgi:hypothetical protein
VGQLAGILRAAVCKTIRDLDVVNRLRQWVPAETRIPGHSTLTDKEYSALMLFSSSSPRREHGIVTIFSHNICNAAGKGAFRRHVGGSGEAAIMRSLLYLAHSLLH